MLKVVIDTNILLVSVSKRSPYHWIFQSLINGDYTLCVTTEILFEYEEIIGKEMGSIVANSLIQLLENLPNVELITNYFCWDLIKTDSDDNKFSDCTIAAGALCLVSHDKHFNILRKIDFPKINVISTEGFKKFLKGRNN
jgi:predicted nucleic acid-binding protein